MSVAGFIPDPPYTDAELDEKLFLYKNPAVAALVVLSALVKGQADQRAELLAALPQNPFGDRSFESYLFGLVLRRSSESGKVDLAEIERQVPQYGPTVFGNPSDSRSLQGDLFTWSQILRFTPTPSQLKQALAVVNENRRSEDG